MTTVRTLLAVGILLLLLVACGRGRNAEEPAAASPAEASSAATTAPATDPTDLPEAAQADAPNEDTASEDVLGGDAQEVVINAMRLQQTGGPYRAVTTVEAHDTTTEMTAEVIPPDKMHIVISGGNIEMILIDGTLWSKTGETPWTQMGSTEMMEGMLDSIRVEIEGSTLSNVQIAGAEPVLGDAAQIYSFTSSFGEGEGLVTSDIKLWISKATGLPLRMEATGTAMGSTSHTVQMIEYDDTITIEPPAQ